MADSFTKLPTITTTAEFAFMSAAAAARSLSNDTTSYCKETSKTDALEDACQRFALSIGDVIAARVAWHVTLPTNGSVATSGSTQQTGSDNCTNNAATMHPAKRLDSSNRFAAISASMTNMYQEHRAFDQLLQNFSPPMFQSDPALDELREQATKVRQQVEKAWQSEMEALPTELFF